MNFEAVKPIQNVSIEQMLLFMFCFFNCFTCREVSFFHFIAFRKLCLFKKKKKCFFFFLHIHQKCVLISIVSDNNV